MGVGGGNATDTEVGIDKKITLKMWKKAAKLVAEELLNKNLLLIFSGKG